MWGHAIPPSTFTPENTTVWSFPDRGDWATHVGNYRGNWSPYIPRNLILRYTAPGELVLDQPDYPSGAGIQYACGAYVSAPARSTIFTSSGMSTCMCSGRRMRGRGRRGSGRA